MRPREREKTPDILFTDGSPGERDWVDRVQGALLKKGIPFRVVISEHDRDKGFDRPTLMSGSFVLENPEVIERYAKNRRAWISFDRPRRSIKPRT